MIFREKSQDQEFNGSTLLSVLGDAKSHAKDLYIATRNLKSSELFFCFLPMQTFRLCQVSGKKCELSNFIG